MKALRAALEAVWGRRYDLCALLGAGAVAYGIGCIYWPAGVITGGLAVSAWGVVGARAEARKAVL